MPQKRHLTEAMLAQILRACWREAAAAEVGHDCGRDDDRGPPSTKNAEKARDGEMHQTKKGKEWHFGLKAPAGTDKRGTVHTVVTTAANEPDIELPKLLHGEEKELLGEQRYGSEFHRQCAKAAAVRASG